MTKLFPIAIAAIAASVTAMPLASARAAAGTSRINVSVDCRCADAVGQKFCSAFKQKLRESTNYRLVDSPVGVGMGVHLSSVDMWQGINGQLLGRMSAMSVAFTIYADKLPGEIYEDSSVFRVGIDAVNVMTIKILAGLDQLVTINAISISELRAGSSPKVAPLPPAH
jgi:hypothetical protein